MRRSKADKAITHSKILAVAAKRFRERGLEGIAVADVMKEAGSSVGGFYKHFGSRDELVVEALAEAFKDLDRWEEEAADLPAFLEQFLSDGNNTRPAIGCAVTAFAGDVRHASTSVRTVYTQRVKHTISYYNNGVKGAIPNRDGLVPSCYSALPLVVSLLHAPSTTGRFLKKYSKRCETSLRFSRNAHCLVS